jgi:hypothetical protein
MYVERCREAVDEMKIFERKPNGSLGAVDGRGNHDDRVITRAMGIHFCYKKMGVPLETEQAKTYTIPTQKIVNEYTL